MKKLALFCLTLISVLASYGQGNIFNRWYFGMLAGLNFNGGPTVLTDGAYNAGEGGASISDASGNLLFYTDGVTIWNKNHSPMPNANGDLMGDWDGTQGSLIVQRPGSTTQYYVFTCPSFAGAATGLRYSIVDMTLDSGNGNVTGTKNMVFPSLPAGLITSEKLTAVRHCNGTDWWIITHDMSAAGSNTYRAWRFSSAGLSNMTTSSAGTTFLSGTPTQAIGWMVGNHTGNRIATACYNKQTVDLADFDNNTGLVSNARISTGLATVYGLEFSPNDSKLYVASGSSVFQYDATTATSATFHASKSAALNAVDAARSMRIASNGKIYLARGSSNWMAVINTPNNAAGTCGWVANGVNMDPAFNGFPANTMSLPNNYKFGNPCVILAVDWLSFDAKLLNEHQVKLGWSTTSERNSAHFIIERSADGIFFQEIGSLAAAGNTDKIHEYAFLDDSSLVGTSYYRLQEIDFDGSSHQSETRVIENDCLSFYPNPAAAYTRINFPKKEVDHSCVLFLYDSGGKLVQHFSKKAGQSSLLLDLSTFSRGVYLLRMGELHTRLIIE